MVNLHPIPNAFSLGQNPAPGKDLREAQNCSANAVVATAFVTAVVPGPPHVLGFGWRAPHSAADPGPPEFILPGYPSYPTWPLLFGWCNCGNPFFSFFLFLSFRFAYQVWNNFATPSQ